MTFHPPTFSTTLKWLLLSSLATLAIGCSPGKPPKAPDNLIGLWNIPFNKGGMVLQKVTQVAYNPSDNSATIVFDPVAPGEANLLKLGYDPKKAVGDQIKSDMALITNSSLRQVLISSDGKYTALTGRARELILLKDQMIWSKLNLADEVTCMKFGGTNENLLALGDRKGNLIVIDLDKLAILNTTHLFDSEITSLAFKSEQQILAAGNDSRILQVDVPSGKIIRAIETRASKENLLYATGIKHCYKDRINQIIYVKSQNKIVASHGWDYCRDIKLTVWDAETGNPIKEVKQIKSPVYQMIWMPGLDTLVLADHDRNLWKLSLSDYKLSEPIYLPQSLAHFSTPQKHDSTPVLVGNVQSMSLIPESNLLLIGTGSYFKGGSGVLLTEVGGDSFKHLARLIIDIRGYAHLFVNEELFLKMYPSTP